MSLRNLLKRNGLGELYSQVRDGVRGDSATERNGYR